MTVFWRLSSLRACDILSSSARHSQYELSAAKMILTCCHSNNRVLRIISLKKKNSKPEAVKIERRWVCGEEAATGEVKARLTAFGEDNGVIAKPKSDNEQKRVMNK